MCHFTFRAEISATCTNKTTIHSVISAPWMWIRRFGSGARTIPARK